MSSKLIAILLFVSFWLLINQITLAQSGADIYQGYYLNAGGGYSDDFSWHAGISYGKGWTGWNTYSQISTNFHFLPKNNNFGISAEAWTSWFLLIGAQIEYLHYKKTQTVSFNPMLGVNLANYLLDYAHLQIFYTRKLIFTDSKAPTHRPHGIYFNFCCPIFVKKIN